MDPSSYAVRVGVETELDGLHFDAAVLYYAFVCTYGDGVVTVIDEETKAKVPHDDIMSELRRLYLVAQGQHRDAESAIGRLLCADKPSRAEFDRLNEAINAASGSMRYYRTHIFWAAGGLS
ncbi:MAG: hypothetical protein P1V36_01695 [Planctomycetota bacterium]|nr:hypothetical protein [Planctomycetota bacterium]